MWHGITQRAVRIGGLGALAIVAAVGVPVAATASSDVARSSGTAGSVYGGRTAQSFPVVIEVNRNRRRVTQAYTAIHLTCTSGRFARLPDRYVRLPVNKRRKFSSSFGPETFRNDDGTTSDFSGSISGTFNRVRSKVSGRWRLMVTDHDSSGAVTDTCDSGSVSWSAKQ